MNALDQLHDLIRTETDALACETHPNVCALRDSAYESLQAKVVAAIEAEPGDPPSVQSALAELETALAEAENDE